MIDTKNIKKTKQGLFDLKAEATALIDGAETANREMTAQERARFDEIMIDAEKHQAAITKMDADTRLEMSRKIGSEATLNKVVAPSAKKDYSSLFGAVSNDGFKSFDEYLSLIKARVSDPRFNASYFAGMNETTPSEGGFSVPTEYVQNIHDLAIEDEIILPRATIYPMKSLTLKIPAWQIGDHSANLYGGMVAYWKAEAATMQTVTPKLREVELNAWKLTGYTVTSNELLSDGISFAQSLTHVFSRGLGWFRDRAFLKGTGVGQPSGILNSDCLIVVAKESEQPNDTICYENLTKMMSRMHAGGFQNSVWIAHQSTIPQLLQLSLSVGVGGSAIPVLKESNGTFTILTRPVIFTEKTEKLGDLGDIMLVDLSQYAIGLRAELRMENSIGPHFDSDQTDWRIVCRVDGMPLWDHPLTLEDGSTTVSPFVALAAR